MLNATSALNCLASSGTIDLAEVMSYLASSSSSSSSSNHNLHHNHNPINPTITSARTTFANLSGSNCSLPLGMEALDFRGTPSAERSATLVAGRLFYAWFTPLVLLVGVVGNTLSLCVFLSRNMRSLSASTYLAALSTADLTALVFYVLVEWLIRGLPALLEDQGGVGGGRGGGGGGSGEGVNGAGTMMAVRGTCQMVMYLHYVSRFLSAWLVVAFTVERYIGVCHPLHRRGICTPTSTRRLVGALVMASFLINIYKPLLTQVQHIKGWGNMCTAHPDYGRLSFVLDSLYAVMITFVPFVVITIFNLLIIRALLKHKQVRKKVRVVTDRSMIHLEFTLILLAVSFCFVALNVPYFATWLKLFLTSRYVSLSTFTRPTDLDYFRGVAFITRAIFYVNYCINFFLYSITGAYFRRALRMLFLPRHQKNKHGSAAARSGRWTAMTSLNHNSPRSQSSLQMSQSQTQV